MDKKRKSLRDIFVLELPLVKCKYTGITCTGCIGIDTKHCRYWKSCSNKFKRNEQKIRDKPENQGKWM